MQEKYSEDDMIIYSLASHAFLSSTLNP